MQLAYPHRPNYRKFFQVLDDAGVSRGADILGAYERIEASSPLRSIMSEIVFDTVAWMIRPQEATSGSRVRFLADAPDSELFFLASLAKRDSIILSDSPVHMWSSELANPNGFELGVLEYLR